MKDTRIIILFDECIKDGFIKEASSKYSIYTFNTKDFSIKYRKPNEEEIEYKKKELEYIDHLIGNDYLIEKFKNTEYMYCNKNYPSNLHNAIKSVNGRYDFVFVNYDNLLADIINDDKLKFMCVLPDDKCIAEWIGRVYLKYKQSLIVDTIIKKLEDFNSIIDKCSRDLVVEELYFGEYFTLEYLNNYKSILSL